MNKRKQLKRELQQFYQAPEPVYKREFLRQFDDRPISMLEFVRRQVPYIHKWNWMAAGVIFLMALVGSRAVGGQIIWGLSAAVPFLALALVAEVNQSARWGMSELELSARFSLKTVTVARLLILGAGNGVLLLVLLPVLCLGQHISVIESGVHILIAYLLSAFLNMIIVRKIHGNENLYACMGMTVLVSGGCAAAGYWPEMLREWMRAGGWIVVLCLLVILTGRELIRMVSRTEEYVGEYVEGYVWN